MSVLLCLKAVDIGGVDCHENDYNVRASFLIFFSAEGTRPELL